MKSKRNLFKERKDYIQLLDFVIDHKFQNFVDKINQRKTSPNWQENTKILGACALQSFEIFAQMLHYEDKKTKYYIVEKEGFLDENFSFNPKNSKLIDLLFKAHLNLRNLKFCATFYENFYKMMYDFNFHHLHFLNINNLRALLEKDEFFKVPILCNIRGLDTGHVNILFRVSEGLYCINTNENSKNKIKFIPNYNGDIHAFEQISYNWIGEYELVESFELFVPYELKKIKIKKPRTKKYTHFNEFLKLEQNRLDKVFKFVGIFIFIIIFIVWLSS